LKVDYVLKIGSSVSTAPIPHVHNVQIQRWSCFADNISSI